LEDETTGRGAAQALLCVSADMAPRKLILHLAACAVPLRN